MVTSKRIGGIRFLKLGRYRLTLCRVTRPYPSARNGLSDMALAFGLTGMALTLGQFAINALS